MRKELIELFTDRHASKIRGELSCLDCVVITCAIPGLCYAAVMTNFLYANGIRIFDYPKWTEFYFITYACGFPFSSQPRRE